MIQIKTLADFKRAIKTGVKLETIYQQGKSTGQMNELGQLIYEPAKLKARPVQTVKTTQFSLLTQRTDGSTQENWLTFPSSKEFKANGTDTVQIYDNDLLILTYKFVD